MPASKNIGEALQHLKGRVLSSVEFVANYVQLRFDGPTLTAYTLPQIVEETHTLSSFDQHYKERLSAHIGARVKDAHFITGKELAISFENEAVIKVSTEEADYKGPEAFLFVGEDGSSWVV